MLPDKLIRARVCVCVGGAAPCSPPVHQDIMKAPRIAGGRVCVCGGGGGAARETRPSKDSTYPCRIDLVLGPCLGTLSCVLVLYPLSCGPFLLSLSCDLVL